ncbi:MAG: zinc ribbon domain-containing protein [Candidatus Thorarchaeota archaeon]
MSKNKELQPLAAYVRCPVHRRVRRLFLPYSRLTEWIGAAGNRLFRCNICGEPAQPKRAGIKGHFTVVLLDCSKHGTKDNKRVLWSPIYTSAKAVNEIQLLEASPLEAIFEDAEDDTSGLICPRCKTENDEDARFCAYCGMQFEL